MQQGCACVNPAKLRNFAHIVVNNKDRINADAKLFGDLYHSFRFRMPADAARREMGGLQKEISSLLAKLDKIALVVLGKNCQENAFVS